MMLPVTDVLELLEALPDDLAAISTYAPGPFVHPPATACSSPLRLPAVCKRCALVKLTPTV